MKKVLITLALALFVGGISAPAIAVNSNALTVVALQEEDPKKAETEKKSETTKKSSECTTSEKSGGDCSKKCEGKKS